MIGELVAGWKLTRKLGEGGTGETYLGERPESGEQAAVKLLFAQASADRALIDRLCADATAASKVNHVGMVDLYACGVHDSGRAFLAMELLEGKTLTDSLIDLGAVTDVQSFADIAWQLATLLAAAHAARLVHGGLKPDSIFLTFPPPQAPRPLVRVLDFGMARFSTSVRHSQTGSLLGAPLYMAPEVGRGLGGADHRADIYSLGCILFEMLCGRPPFVREGAGELIIAHASEAPPPVAALEPSVPQAIDSLIGRMLTKNSATRPQNMGEVAAVLERFFDCPAPGAVVPSPVVAEERSRIPTPVFPATPPPATPRPGSSIAVDTTPTPRPEPQGHLGTRRQDATALLPPGAADLPNTGAGTAWVARVRERTAFLAPSSAASVRRAPQGSAREVELPAPAAKPMRRGDRSGPPHDVPQARPNRPGLNLPLVIVTASIALALGAGILFLRARRSTVPARTPASELRRQPAPFEPFRPPSSPTPQATPPARPQPLVTPEDHEEEKGLRHPQPPNAPRRAPPDPEPRRPVKRW